MSTYTHDEQLINKAGQDLQVMLETSAFSPAECLRRAFSPVLEQVRADVKAAGLEVPRKPALPTRMRDAIRQTIAEDDHEYDFQDETTGRVDFSNSDVDHLADIIAAAIENELPGIAPKAVLEAIRDTARASLKPDIFPNEESWLRSKIAEIERLTAKALR